MSETENIQVNSWGFSKLIDFLGQFQKWGKFCINEAKSEILKKTHLYEK